MNHRSIARFVWFPEGLASLGWVGQDISPVEVERIQQQVFGVVLNQPDIPNHETYRNLIHQRLSLIVKADNPTDDQHRRAVVFGSLFDLPSGVLEERISELSSEQLLREFIYCPIFNYRFLFEVQENYPLIAKELPQIADRIKLTTLDEWLQGWIRLNTESNKITEESI